MVNSLLAVRLVGVGDYGHMATWLSLFVLYLSLNSSVFTVLVVKLMAQGQQADKAERARLIAAATSFVGGSLGFLTILTLLLAVTVALFRSESLGAFAGDGRLWLAILLMGLLTGLQILSGLQAALIESAGRLDLAMKCQLFGPFVVLTALVFFFGFGAPITVAGYVILLCAGAVADLAATTYARRILAIDPNPLTEVALRRGGLGGFLRFGGVLQATSLMNLFLEPLNKVVLNHFAGAYAVTVYDLAMKVIWGIQSLFSAMMRVFLHLGSQDRESVGKGFFLALNLLIVPVLVFHAVGALFLFWVARYWLAIDHGLVLAFFAVASLSNIAMIGITPLYVSLIGCGELGFIFRTQAILAITNVSVSLILIPEIGLIGSAIGLLVATVYNALAIYRRCRVGAVNWPGLRGTLRQGKWRLIAASGLFVAALLWSLQGGTSRIFLYGILLCLAVVSLREPAFVNLVERIRPRK